MANNEKATFQVQILTRRNNTWQGRVVWADAHKTQYFRSALELIQLIDSTANGEETAFESTLPTEE